MAIDGALREKLEPGTKLVARYKGKEHQAEVVAGEDGKVRFRLADGREFKSPSAAGSAVMGGTACNGWRFWSIAEEETGQGSAPAPRTTARRARKSSGKESKGAQRVETSGAGEPTAHTADTGSQPDSPAP